MTISDVNGLIASIIGPATIFGKDSTTAEAAGIPHTPWYGTGLIGAGAAPTGGLNGATFSGTVAGQIPIPAAVSGKTSVIERMSAIQTGNIGMLWVIDRLWGNVPVVTTTTSQAITSPTWPSRDSAASSNGAGVYLALETSSATGNGSPITNTTVSYTNTAGTSGRTATMASYPATAVVGTWQMFSLTAGDLGVKSVQSITLGTSYVSGQVHLMAFRLVAALELPNLNTGNKANVFDAGMPTVWDNSVLQLVYWPAGTACGALAGSITYAQG